MNVRRSWWLPGLLLATACASTLDRARVAYDQGDVQTAESLYRQAISDPDEGQVAREELADLLVLGAKSIEKSEPASAVATYQAALELLPTHDGALTGAVRVLRRQGDAAGAARVLAEARQAGRCGACNRLEGIVLLEQAEAALAAGDWPEAIKSYEAIQASRPQPGPGLALVRAHIGAGDTAKAAEALAAAAALIRANDTTSAQTFGQLRQELVLAAMDAGDMEMVDRLRGIAPEGLTAADQVALSLAVADRLRDAGKIDEAMARYDELIKAADEGKLGMSMAERTDINRRLALLYSRAATSHLHAGRATEADAELSKALALDPDNWVLKLQRILALSETTGGARALQSLSLVPAGTAGLKQVRAIVASLDIIELVKKGKRVEAVAALESLQASFADMPEAHLAAAWVVSTGATEDLSGAEVRALKKASLVRYPGAVLRYAEALGELEMAASDAHNRGSGYPYRAPWFQREHDALSAKLKAVYPFAVKFSPNPEGQVVFKNTGSNSLTIEVAGPGGFETEVVLASGKDQKVMIPDPGLLRLRVNGKYRTFFAESYAIITVTL